MDNSKKIVVGMLVLTVFVLVVSIASLYVQVTIESGNACGCVIPLPFFIPFIGSVGLFIGTLVYYLFSPGTERKPDVNSALRLLSGDEASVMKALAKSGGSLSQAGIVKATGLSKVKVFRVIARMLSRGLVEKESSGKTNIIHISRDIRNLFVE